MAERAAKIRLFVEDPLGPNATVAPGRDQARYLHAVMRRAPGDEVLLFNGRDGEWRARVEQAGRRGGLLRCVARVRAQSEPPDLWLVFAPVKKTRTDFIVEKATELGARRILPVFTRRTDAARVRADRLIANAVEAAEQCGRLSAPEIGAPAGLEAVLESWDPGRRLMFCDPEAETPAAEALRRAGPGPWAILIGPEGGFAREEAERLRARPFATPVALGRRILRAETAAAAAMTLWQAALGDWR